MKSKVQYVMSYEITPHPRSTMFDPPPHVFLRRCGGEASTLFTPDEARRLGEALIAAAGQAEAKQ